MSSGTSFAFDPLPATQSASGPPLSPQHSQWIMGKLQRLCSKKAPDSISLKVERYNGKSEEQSAELGVGEEMEEEKVEQISESTLGTKSRKICGI